MPHGVPEDGGEHDQVQRRQPSAGLRELRQRSVVPSADASTLPVQRQRQRRKILQQVAWLVSQGHNLARVAR